MVLYPEALRSTFVKIKIRQAKMLGRVNQHYKWCGVAIYQITQYEDTLVNLEKNPTDVIRTITNLRVCDLTLDPVFHNRSGSNQIWYSQHHAVLVRYCINKLTCPIRSLIYTELVTLNSTAIESVKTRLDDLFWHRHNHREFYFRSIHPLRWRLKFLKQYRF